MPNKMFWSTVKPFLTNKGCISNVSADNDADLLSNEKEPMELFNQNYINIAENSSGNEPSSIGDCTAQKIKFSIKDFFSKCDQIRSFLRIWSHLLKKSLMKNFIFCAVLLKCFSR